MPKKFRVMVGKRLGAARIEAIGERIEATYDGNDVFDLNQYLRGCWEHRRFGPKAWMSAYLSTVIHVRATEDYDEDLGEAPDEHWFEIIDALRRSDEPPFRMPPEALEEFILKAKAPDLWEDGIETAVMEWLEVTSRLEGEEEPPEKVSTADLEEEEPEEPEDEEEADEETEEEVKVEVVEEPPKKKREPSSALVPRAMEMPDSEGHGADHQLLTDAQQEIRKTGITASEVAAILGISPWSGPVEIFLAKHKPQPWVDNENAEWGRRNEAAVRKKFMDERPGCKLWIPEGEEGTGTVRHAEHDWMLATPDAVMNWPELGDLWRLVEIKTTGQGKWSEAPEYYAVQVIWQHLVLSSHSPESYDQEQGHIAALFGGNKYDEYDVLYDDEMAEMLVETCGKFWKEHIEAKVMPDPMKSPDPIEVLKHLHTDDSGKLIAFSDADPDVLSEVKRLLNLLEGTWKPRAKMAETAVNKCKAKLQDIIRKSGHSGFIGQNGIKATWKKGKGSQKIDFPGVVQDICDEYEIPAEKKATIIKKRTTKKDGSRMFLSSLAKES